MLYDYECSNCKHFMEDVYQSIKDDPLTKCPQCGKNKLERIIYGGTYASVKKQDATHEQKRERIRKDGGIPLTYKTNKNIAKKVERENYNLTVNSAITKEFNNYDPKDRKKQREKIDNNTKEYFDKLYHKEMNKKKE